jgi:NitT/TauT family transport system substrate-binding protein
VVLVIDVSHGADAVIGRAGLGSMRDLAGRSVAVESGALGAFMLSRALALSGMHAGDVKVVHLESNEQPAAFEKGQVDAAVTFDPYRAQLLGAGGRTLFDSTRIPGEIVDLVAVRDSVLRDRPQAVTALLTGWFGAIDFMKAEPEEAARRMAVRQQSSARQVLDAQRGLHVPTRAENLTMLGGANPTLAVTGRRLMSLMLEARLLRAGVDIESLLAPGPLASLPQ